MMPPQKTNILQICGICLTLHLAAVFFLAEIWCDRLFMSALKCDKLIVYPAVNPFKTLTSFIYSIRNVQL